ncbi:MAG: hypothetical protein WA488_24160 [Mycobacterium sp.]|uniref:hypothetical protein n=1 Tax=Mycobacterium sp. TaxID=1785 RepID=UPI003BB77369
MSAGRRGDRLRVAGPIAVLDKLYACEYTAGGDEHRDERQHRNQRPPRNPPRDGDEGGGRRIRAWRRWR